MGILAPDFTWRQTLKSLVVNMPLKGASSNEIDIVATELLVKVSFGRYLLHLDLREAIDDHACAAKIKQGTLTLKLKKLTPRVWETLEADKSNLSKSELQCRRSQSIEARVARDVALNAKFKNRQVEDERMALRTQMALDEDERSQIDDIKTEEKKNAEDAIYKRFVEIEHQKHSVSSALDAPTYSPVQDSSPKSRQKSDHELLQLDNYVDSLCSSASEDSLFEHMSDVPSSFERNRMCSIDGLQQQNVNKCTRSELLQKEGDVLYETKKCSKMVADEGGIIMNGELVREEDYEVVDYPNRGDLDETDAPLPYPRASGVLKMKFTPRIFPTPMRESKINEEEDWIAKNRSHLRKNPQLRPQLDALDIEDSDPT